MQAPWLHAALVAALLCTSQAGWAHDSWLSVTRTAWQPGRAVLDLGTGTRYPAAEVSPAPESLVRSGCSDGGRALPLEAGARSERTLSVAAPFAQGRAPLACWTELAAASIELEPRIVQLYFKDIQASDALRETWARLQSRGIRWQETYRKFARIELAGAPGLPVAALVAARKPVGLDLEIVVLGERPVRVGEPLEFQVLRDGRPLADFPVELVSDRNPLGIWRRTDAQGKVQHRLPFGGQWLLRGTDLRLSTARPDSWESRFATLVVEAPDAPSPHAVIARAAPRP